MKKIFTTFFILILCNIIFPQAKMGTTAAAFLEIPVGPRATAMGSSFTSIANDVTAAFWNPGGLSRLTRNEFAASFTEWIVDTRINWFGVAVKFDDDNAFALSFNQLDYGEEDITTPEQPNGTGERWGAQDLAVAVSYARNLTDRFSIGGSVKYISQQIWNESASAFALDIGLLFHTQLDGFRIGMNISNFGTELKLDGKDLLLAADIDPTSSGNNGNISSLLETESWPLPLVFSVGVSYDIARTEEWLVTAATDAVIPNNQTTYANAGAEIIWNNMISLRGGYKGLNFAFQDKDYLFLSNGDVFEETFSVGAGVQYDFGGFFAKFDYSYSDFGIFSEISRFSLSVGL